MTELVTVVHKNVSLNDKEIQAILAVAQKLERPNKDFKFDMERVCNEYRGCGTPLCLAGHICHFLGITDPEEMQTWFDRKQYQDQELRRLFSTRNPSDIKLALEAIYHYLTTGLGTWPYWSRIPVGV